VDVSLHEVWALLKLMTLLCNCSDEKDEKIIYRSEI